MSHQRNVLGWKVASLNICFPHFIFSSNVTKWRSHFNFNQNGETNSESGGGNNQIEPEKGKAGTLRQEGIGEETTDAGAGHAGN